MAYGTYRPGRRQLIPVAFTSLFDTRRVEGPIGKVHQHPCHFRYLVWYRCIVAPGRALQMGNGSYTPRLGPRKIFWTRKVQPEPSECGEPGPVLLVSAAVRLL